MTETKRSELEVLAEQAEQARAALAKAEAKAEAERAAAEQRRAKAHEQFDRQVLADFDLDSLDAEVDQARAALREAILADPVWQAAVRLNVAQYARAQGAQAYTSAASRLGVEVAPVGVPPYWPVNVEDDLVRFVTGESERHIADLADAHDQARVDAGENAAKRRT